MHARLTPLGTAVLAVVALAGSSLVAPGAAVGSGLAAGVRTPAPATKPATRPATEQASAPDGPGGKTVWTEADKAGFGTARARRSNVWFTLQRGRTSEVFYPDLSTPSVRNLELVVTDGRTFTDRESTDTRHRTTRPDVRSLGFTEENTARSGKYRITKRFVTDPLRDALDVHVRLQSLDGGHYRLFALYDPALNNSGGTTPAVPWGTGWSPPTPTRRSPPRWSRGRASTRPPAASSAPATGGRTCARTTASTSATPPPARATWCRPAGSAGSAAGRVTSVRR